MSENQAAYGFSDDKPTSGGISFGLNSGVTRMTNFAFNPNGGKDGEQQEVLDVVFDIDGKETNNRMFPVTKAFLPNNGGETTDPNHDAFKKAMQEFNGTVVHIMKAFVPEEQLKAALSVPIASFQQFCNVCVNLLPSDYKNRKLDVFGQWQWQMTGENSRTFVNLPRNVKHGRFICAHVAPVNGPWVTTNPNGGLVYLDGDGNKHPFNRNKWFMGSNFAKQQAEESMSDIQPNIQPGTAPNATGGSQTWE